MNIKLYIQHALQYMINSEEIIEDNIFSQISKKKEKNLKVSNEREKNL